MADAGRHDAVRRPLAELFLLGRSTVPGRVLVGVLALALCAVAAQGSLALQHHYVGDGGFPARVLGRGPSAATCWPGWAAAVFFAMAVVRLRRGALEPPAGRAPLESMSLLELRTGLVREYTLVRAGLVVVVLLALADGARAARYLLAAGAGDGLAGAAIPWLVVQAAGLVLAAALLAGWAYTFRAQLERLGALPPVADQLRRSTT